MVGPDRASLTGAHRDRVLRIRRSPFELAVFLQLTVATMVLVAVGWLLGLPIESTPPAADVAVVDSVSATPGTTAYDIVAAIGRVGHLAVIAPLALLIALIARWRSGCWELGLLMATVVGGATGVTGALKLLVERARPDDSLTLTAAFPSGHAVRGVAVLGLIGWIVRAWSRRRTVRALAIPLAVALIVVNGVARVVLGVHWPTDVLAGFLLGGAWLAVSFRLIGPHVVDTREPAPAV